MLDKLLCHVVSDESAEQLDEVDEHRLEGLGGRGVSVRHDRLGNAANVGLRPGTELNLRQRRVLGPRLCEPAREQRVAAVGTNPPRERPVQMVAGSGGGSRGRVALRSFGPVTVDQVAGDASRRRLVR
jgi:hypothetical protein